MNMYGSFQNRMAEQAPASAENLPAIGDGATEKCYSDRRAYFVSAIGGTAKRPVITIQAATTKNKAVYPAQDYDITPNPNGNTHQVKLVKRNGTVRWMSGGNVVRFGFAQEHYDPSF